MVAFKPLMWIISLSVICWLVFLLFRKTRSGPLAAFFFPALALKLIAGIALGLLYFYVYGKGDTVAYHEDAIVLSDLAFQDFPVFFNALISGGGEDLPVYLQYAFQPRALWLVKTLSVTYLLTGQSYWIASVLFSLFCFAGFWFLAGFLTVQFHLKKLSVLVSFFFFPSLVFWSSGTLKESLAMGALAFIVCFCLAMLCKRKINWIKTALLVVFFLVLWKLKYYYAAVLAPVLFALVMANLFFPLHFIKRRKGLAVIGLIGLIVIFASLAMLLHPNFRPERFFDVIVSNYQTFLRISDPDNVVVYHDLQPNFLSLLAHAPQALAAGLFRPFIWETDSLLEAAAGVENLVILILCALSITRYQQAFRRPDYLFITGVVVYIVVLATLLALSTPNFGALSRYRVGFLPFLLLLVTGSSDLWRRKIIDFHRRLSLKKMQ